MPRSHEVLTLVTIILRWMGSGTLLWAVLRFFAWVRLQCIVISSNADDVRRICDALDAWGFEEIDVFCARTLIQPIREAFANLDAAIKSGDPGDMEWACDRVQASGMNANCIPDVRLQARRIRSLANLNEADEHANADEMDRACDEVEAAGADVSRVPDMRVKARRIRALADLSAAVTSGDPEQMETACKKAEECGAGSSHVLEVRLKVRRIRAVAELALMKKANDSDRMEKACNEVEESGADASFVPDVRKRIKRIRAALAQLQLAERGVDLDEMDKACDSAETLGINSSCLRLKARRIRALAKLADTETGSNADALENACDEVDASGANAYRLPELRKRVRRLRLHDELNATINTDDTLHICIVCSVARFKYETAHCSSQSHAICAICLEAYAREEYTRDESTLRKRGARLLCPLRAPHQTNCNGCFSDQSIAQFLSADLHTTYMDKQRAQSRFEEFTAFNKVLANIGSQMQKNMPGLSQELLERQLREAVPGARQCKQCSFGPVDHFDCANLRTHHGQKTGRSKISNACPECGWFSDRIEDWPRWNGRVRIHATAQASAVGLVQRETFHNHSQAASSHAQPGPPHEEQILAQIRSDHELAVRLSRRP